MCEDDTIHKLEIPGSHPTERSAKLHRSSGSSLPVQEAGKIAPKCKINQSSLRESYIGLVELLEGENKERFLGRLDPALIVAMAILRDDSISSINIPLTEKMSDRLKMILFETVWHGYLLAVSYHSIKDGKTVLNFRAFLDSGILSQQIALVKTAIAGEIVKDMLPEEDFPVILSLANTIVSQTFLSLNFSDPINSVFASVERDNLIKSTELLVFQGILLGLLEFEIKTLRTSVESSISESSNKIKPDDRCVIE